MKVVRRHVERVELVRPFGTLPLYFLGYTYVLI